MSTKTCQLCGKPLGRRADGEFCSREHRNQLRLRKGMDRLEEANKMASLMRRRETPRPIPADQLLVLGVADPLPSTTAAPFPLRHLEPGLAPLKPVLFKVRIASHEQRFANPVSDLLRRSSAAASQLATPAAVQFLSPKPTAGLKKMLNHDAQLSRAGIIAVRCDIPAPKEKVRECGAALRVSRRASLPE